MKLTSRALTLGMALSLAPALSVAQATAAAPEGPVRSLIEQGQYWQQRGRADRAIEAWQKLLRIVPDQPDALIGMARASASGGDQDGARRYLDRLKAVAPKDTRIASLEAELAQGSPAKQGQLDEARNLARAGKSEEALKRYNAVTDGKVPTDPRLALEYYQTLGGTKGGWQEAYAGLQRLQREHPDDPQIALALAEHMTYQEPTRRAGIEQLSRLAAQPELSKRARESWRRALGWLGTRQADAPAYQAWLKQVPEDAEIRRRIDLIGQNAQTQAREDAEGRAAAAAGRAVTAAYASLDAGDLAQARSRFNEVLAQHPDDNAALGGLGLIELQQKNYEEAERLLTRASRTAPARWNKALASARYWQRFEAAREARNNGQIDQANELLRGLVAANPDEPAGVQAYADVLAERGQDAAAETQYRALLKRRPKDLDVLRGLMSVMARQGRFDEAIALAEGLSPEQREQLGPLGRLRAERYRRLATEATQRGDMASARSALEEALRNDPNNIWVRLDLARLYVRGHAIPEARGLIDGLLLSEPGQADALYASALLYAETRDWDQVLATLQAIRPEDRSRDMAQLQTRAWVQQQAGRAAELSRSGQGASALAMLRQVEPYVMQEPRDPDLLGTLAAAYADAGDSARALNLIRSLVARNGQADTAMTLRYANILLASKQQVELAGVMRQLAAMPLDPTQRVAYENLRRGYLLQQADSLREAGDLETAYERLSPLLSLQPVAPEALSALARLHASAGQHAQALAIYQQLLASQPDDPDLLLAGGGAALGARQLDEAQALAESGLARRPQDARFLTLAGRVARAQGRPREAEQYLRAALAAEEANRQAALRLAGGGVASGGNPFAASALAAETAANPFAGMTGGRRATAAAQAATNALPTFPPSYPTTAPAASTQPMSYLVPSAAPLPPAYAPAPAPAPVAYAPAPVAYAQPPVAQAPAPRSASTRTANSKRSTTRQAVAAPVQQPLLAAAPQPYDPLSMPVLPPAPVAAPRAPLFGEVTPAAASANARRVAAAPAVRTLRDELAELQQDRATTLQVSSNFRSRSGEAGLGKLNEFKLPIEAQTNVGEGRLSLQVVPTVVDSGTPDSGYAVASRFGGGPAVSLGNSGTAGSQGDQGVALGLGYTVDGLDLKLGSTPLGFQYATVVGSASWRTTLGDGGPTVQVAASRRQLDDSVLSMAGAYDIRTNERWGGMVATGLRLDLADDEGAYELYGWAAGDVIQGHNVETNTRFEAGGGLNYHLIRGDGESLDVGVRLTVLGYDKNQRFFTYGHGGYFSPQAFASLALPVEWKLRSGKADYALGGAIGVQGFKENAVDYLPGDAVAQAAAVRAATSAVTQNLATEAPTVYPSQSKLGISYELHGRLAYRLSPRLQLVGQLGLDNARDYQQFSGGVSLRYAWPQQDESRPAPLRFSTPAASGTGWR